MEEVGMAIFSIIFSLLSLLVPVLIIGGIVYFVMRRRNGGAVITTYRALLAYFHLITVASVVIMAVGAGYLAFVGFSLIYGGRSPIDDELTLGLALLGTGAVVCALHVVGRRAVEKAADPATRMFQRIYLFLMLAIFSLVGLGALPSAIHDTVRYYVTGDGNNPAAALATAVVTVPMWGYYLWRVLREFRRGVQEDTPTVA